MDRDFYIYLSWISEVFACYSPKLEKEQENSAWVQRGFLCLLKLQYLVAISLRLSNSQSGNGKIKFRLSDRKTSTLS